MPLPWMRQIVMRPAAVETATVQVKAAANASLPSKSRSPIAKQPG